MIGASFDSTETPLQDLLAGAGILVRRIEAETGKPIKREPELFRHGVEPELYDERPKDWDAEESLEEAAS